MVSIPERERDMMSKRRSLLTGEDRKAFDAHYGRPKSTRSKSDAGKGDAPRMCDKTLYDLGWLISHGETAEIRSAAEAEWYARRGVNRGT